MKSNKHPFNGLLLLDKPLYMSSHQAVSLLRHKLKMKQIGHAGTLDPMATGLLILMIGNATKTSQYLITDNKKYRATIQLGQISSTYDAEGTITKKVDPSAIKLSEISEVTKKLVGKQMQTPPMFSAKKVNGKKLYHAARQGLEVERKAHEITIYDISILDYQDSVLSCEIHCSKGTYIRSIAHEIGEILGCGAYLSSLRRIESGDFTIDNTITHDEIMKIDVNELAQRLKPFDKYLPKSTSLLS